MTPTLDSRDWVVETRSPEAKIPLLLFSFLIALFVFPADMVIAPIGAVGFVAMLLALIMFAIWVTSLVFGARGLFADGSPARLALVAIWIATIAAYILTPGQTSSIPQRAAADRWILSLCGISGVVAYFSARVRSLSQIASAVRALSIGGSICAVVALYQFLTFSDPVDWLRPLMIGFTENGGNTTFQIRSSFVRVAGTTFSPIELGVVAAMLLPFAAWRALFDSSRRKWLMWVQVALVAMAAVMTVSRSAILSLFLVAVVFFPTLPKQARRWALVVTPVCIMGVFVVLPGFLTTISEAFGAGTSDPSLATRVNNYPRVIAMVLAHPWAGIGPGAYAPTNALQILDNQYLMTTVNMGVVGLLALLLLFGFPLVSNLQVAFSARADELRCLAGAGSAASAVAVASSATFDSFSFPVFLMMFATLLGLSASIWLRAKHGPVARDSAPSGVSKGK